MRKAGDVLESLFRDRFGQGFVEKARSTAGLFSTWADMTAEAWPFEERTLEDDDFPPDLRSAAASHSRIREFERGALLVEADHPGWVQILQTKQQALLSIARRRFPELDIRSISFCLSREPFSFAAREPAAPQVSLQTESPRTESLRTESLRTVSPKIPAPGKNARTGDELYYEALKRFELSVKEKNIQ